MSLLSLLKAKKRCRDIVKKYYPIYEDRNIVYKNLIEQYLLPSRILLDAGCGRGKNTLPDFKGKVKLAIGIDLSIQIKENNKVDKKILGDITRIPLKDKSVDIVACQQLIEHLKYPGKFFREVARIMKPKGIFILMTPNVMHWTSLIARFTPHWLHLVLDEQIYGIEDEDVFPTYYRANTPFGLKNYLKKIGFRIIKNCFFETPPRTLTFSVITTYSEILYTKIVRRYNFLKYFRDTIILISVKIS